MAVCRILRQYTKHDKTRATKNIEFFINPPISLLFCKNFVRALCVNFLNLKTF